MLYSLQLKRLSTPSLISVLGPLPDHFCNCLALLGPDPAWALSDTKLGSEDLRLARRRAVSKQESKIEQEENFKRKKGLEVGVSNVPLLLAYYSQYTTWCWYWRKDRVLIRNAKYSYRGVVRISPKLKPALVHLLRS
jgi:hypothetical protein